MYGPLWRTLPGPWPVKLLQALVLTLAFVAAGYWDLTAELAPAADADRAASSFEARTSFSRISSAFVM